MTFRHPEPCLCDGIEHVREQDRRSRSSPTTRSRSASSRSARASRTRSRSAAFTFFLYEKTEKAQYVEEYAQALLRRDARRPDAVRLDARGRRRAGSFIDPIVDAWEDGRRRARTTTRPATAEVRRSAPTRSCRRQSRARRRSASSGSARWARGSRATWSTTAGEVVGFNRHADVRARDGGRRASMPAETLRDLRRSARAAARRLADGAAGAPVDELLFGATGRRSGGAARAGRHRHRRRQLLLPRRRSRARQRLAELGIHFLDSGTSAADRPARATGAC